MANESASDLNLGTSPGDNPAPSEANGNLRRTLTGIENPPSAKLAPQGTKLYNTTHGNFAPRLGVAYQPFRGAGTVIRAGFGGQNTGTRGQRP